MAVYILQVLYKLL